MMNYEVSDLIVVGDLKSIKQLSIKTIKTKSTDPESYAAKHNKDIVVKAPIIIYNLKITELIKGEAKTKNIDLIMSDLNFRELQGLVEGGSYKLYLIKNNSHGDDAYSLVSFSQGYEIIE